MWTKWLRGLAFVVPFFVTVFYFAGVFDESLRVSADLEPSQCWLSENIVDPLLNPITANEERPLTALFARLHGGEQPDDTNTLVDAVSRASIPGLSIRKLCSVLLIRDVDDYIAAKANADEQGREWLRRRNGDVLVWGETRREGGYRLRITAVASPMRELPVELESQDFSLPKELVPQLAEVIALAVLASVQPSTESEGRAVVAALQPQMPKLRALANNPTLPLVQRRLTVRVYRSALFLMGEQSSDPQWLEEAEKFNAADTAVEDAATAQFYRANALLGQGKKSDGPAKLREAIRLYRRVSTIWTLKTAPLDWARTQNNLGSALVNLGELTNDAARLEEAVQTYREALKVRTRKRLPLDWAMTQNNLGSALWSLGKRERETARLEQAVQVFREALEEVTREFAPLNWATIKNNLGTALQSIGERDIKSSTRLKEAVQTYHEALEERTRERDPLGWATIKNNLGTALLSLGEREDDTAQLEQAVQALREALEERTRQNDPRGWAGTQSNLGAALLSLGKRGSNTAPLEQAVQAFSAALEVTTRESDAFLWATIQNNLGTALVRLGERESGTTRFEAAVQAFSAALEVTTRESDPLGWAGTKLNLGVALWWLGERESSAERFEAAVQVLREALKEFTRESEPFGWASTQFYLSRVFFSLHQRNGKRALLTMALGHIDGALEIYRTANVKSRIHEAEEHRAKILAAIEKSSGSAK